MKNISETGHGINLSNMKLQIDHCTSFGAAYNPSNADLSIANMTAKWDIAKAQHEAAREALQQSKEPINKREILYEGLSKLVTRVVGHLDSLKVSQAIRKDARGLADRIRGNKVRGKTLANGEENPNYVSNSHMSFVMRAESFRDLISLVSTVTAYAPNETDLSIASMSALSHEMDVKNEEIGVILAPVAMARIARNKELYAPETGLLDVAYASKDYVKGVFGSRSPEHKLVSGIRYTRPKA
ncbi:MAG: hypothetical protein JNJ58_07170 [Chitinophagaceae bacterium]|nr:hypothetical protein [Chitinophagaceae bacterium]